MKKYIAPSGRFFKINIKDAKKALKENAPQLFGIGVMLGGTGYATDKIANQIEKESTAPQL
jgi:hypothetical protein